MKVNPFLWHSVNLFTREKFSVPHLPTIPTDRGFSRGHRPITAVNPQWVRLSHLGRVFIMTQMNSRSLCDPNLNSNCMLLCLSQVWSWSLPDRDSWPPSLDKRGVLVWPVSSFPESLEGQGNSTPVSTIKGQWREGQIFYFSFFLHSCVNPLIWGHLWHPGEAFSSNVHLYLQHLNYPSTDF